ncbi:hypothetical protein LTR86_011015 [Recurvomyces mirabilis]|nr:hypothetical protein LTR86_011015 [Recurvomyces mirabilis]
MRKETSIGVTRILTSVSPQPVLTSTACGVFFTEYLNSTAGFARCDFDFISPIYGKVEADGMLASMVATLGITFIARKSKSRSLLPAAGHCYSRVLRLTAAALLNSETAKSDEMLATIWLLALHESIALGGLRVKNSCSAHLDGASKLLLLRGEGQFGSDIGRGVFLRLVGWIVSRVPLFAFGHRLTKLQVLNCLACSTPVHLPLLRLMHTGWKHYHTEAQAELALLDLASELCVIVSPKCKTVHPSIRAKYQMLIDLDSRITAWPSTLTERYAIRRVHARDVAPLQWYDIYHCHVSAVVWNRYRRIRIETLELIVQYAQLLANEDYKPDQAWETSQRRAVCALSRLSEDVCYSVPYLLNQGALVKKPSQQDCNDITICGGTSVLVALTLATNKERVPAMMNEWMLDQIGRITRIKVTKLSQGVYIPWPNWHFTGMVNEVVWETSIKLVSSLNVRDIFRAQSQTERFDVRFEVTYFSASDNGKQLALTTTHAGVSLIPRYKASKIEGDKLTFFRHQLYLSDIATDLRSEASRAYKITRAIYEVFFPQHLARIKNALSKLRGSTVASFTSRLDLVDGSQESTISNSSQEAARFKKPSLSSTAMLQRENERLREQLLEAVRIQ